jgi:hypothetical protein
MMTKKFTIIAAALAAAALVPQASRADEGGVSMWIPGFYGSLAATPLQPGFSFASILYHTSVSADAAVAVSREITIGRFNPVVDINAAAQLRSPPSVLLAIPSYTFATPVLGGQATVVALQGIGYSRVSIDALIEANVGPFSITREEHLFDARYGFTDLGLQGNLRWNHGVHNFMTYGYVNVPSGTYNSTQLANLGIGHWAVDGGAGYTYFNPQTGHEFSGVLGFTYNFINPSTQYKNGIDMHFDWGASQFLSKQLQIGLVGYAYQQLTCDSGTGDRVGCFESRVFGIGPQLGYIFPIGTTHQGYFNVKGYKEFEAENRPEGWNVWLTLSISPAGAPPPPASTPMIRK